MNKATRNSHGPQKTPDEYIEDIEAAEEAGNIDAILNHISLFTKTQCIGGDGEGDGELFCNRNAGNGDWTEAMEASLDAFYRLIKAGRGNNNSSIASILATSYLNKMFYSLNCWKEEEVIVEVALGCIVAITSKAAKPTEDDTVDEEGNVIGDTKLVLAVMKKYKDESTIQEQACLAIEGLALFRDNWKDAFRQLQGIKEELKAAREERITNERNKAYPLRAGKAFGVDLGDSV